MCISVKIFSSNVYLCVLDLPATAMKKVSILISNFKTTKKNKTKKTPPYFLSNVPVLKHSRFPDLQINLRCD